ncbi:MAG: PAS domain-containing sensor histidine kinase, partial [Clostridia bacterium]|nr:PAS domain-containing sensor histidine kinase [Clostridia bacterium]
HEDKIIKLTCSQFNDENRRWIRITVEDHGGGIPEGIRSEIYEPFFTSKSRDRGTGLGLYVSYGIVKDHHGRLTFDTEEGKFTRFYVDLLVDNGWELE